MCCSHRLRPFQGLGGRLCEALLVYAAVIGFAPIILAALASRFVNPELLRPVSALQTSGQGRFLVMRLGFITF